MASRPLIKQSLQMLNVFGMNPLKNNLLSNLLMSIQTVLYVQLIIEMTLQLLWNFTDLDSADDINVLGMIFQCVARVVVIVANRQVLARLINKVERFWPPNKYDKEVQLEIDFMQGIVVTFFKICTVFLGGTIVAYMGRPALTVNRTLPFETYHPTNRYNNVPYMIMYAIEFLDIFMGGFAVLSFDCLFISLIVNIVCELKALKREFRKVSIDVDGGGNYDQCMEEIKELVDHHNLILECIKDMNKGYKLFLLNQFLLSIILVCAALVTMIASGIPPDLPHFFKFSAFCGLILNQLFVYCAAGTYLISETESVSDAVYASNWWAKTQPKLRRAFALIIQRANKSERLTAGGMFTLDLESFTRVLRTSLSFFTLVQAMYTRTEDSK